MQCQGDLLKCFRDPEGLVWDATTAEYQASDFTYSSQEQFNVADIPRGTLVKAREFPEGLVRLLYGRSFQELPQVMQEGNKEAQIVLPSHDKIVPVGRGYFYINYYIGSSRASRGVREKR